MVVITRAQWGAAAPKRAISPFLALDGLSVHHSASPAPVNHSDCPGAVRGIQHYQMVTEGVYDDIAYNWIVCPHGTIYEGRGWGHHSGANGKPGSTGYHNPTRPGKDANYYIPAACVLGSSPAASVGVVNALRAIRADLVRLHKEASGVWPHSAIVPTECPGNPLRAWVAAKGYLPAPTQTTIYRVAKDGVGTGVQYHTAVDALDVAKALLKVNGAAISVRSAQV